MSNNWYKILFLVIASVTYNIVYAQEIPPIHEFSVEDYGAENQNWMISQAKNNFIYVANNKGLLEFDGAHWSTYPSPNNTIIRAVKVVGEKIYTGCYSEFGYWEKDKSGVLMYTSLIPKLDEDEFINEDTWNIIEYNDLLLFQTNSHIFIYHTTTEKFTKISSDNLIYKIFKVDNQIYFHVANEGIYLIEDGSPTMIIDSPVVLEDRVINVFKHKGKLQILTRTSGFFNYENNELIKWDIAAKSELEDVSIFDAIQLVDGSFIIGTISKGILHLSAQGDLNYTINQKKGLSNNTVLSIFEDKHQNVWLGLDNGINCINVNSPIKTFTDYDGVLGTIYVTKVFKDYLYVGTNQGLFYRKLESVNDSFKFINGTAGQVWALYNYNNKDLLCGHHLGTFLINENNITQVSDHLGAWNFKPIPNHEQLLLVGNYDGLYILEKKNNSWQLRNKIEGFSNSSRYFEIDNDNQVWVSQEFRGVYNIKLNDSLNEALKVEKETNLPLGEKTSLIKYKNDILYMSEQGVYKYINASQKFSKDSLLSAVVSSNNYVTGKMVVGDNGKLWMFPKDDIRYLVNDDVTNNLKVVSVPIPTHFRRSPLGFENIAHIQDEQYILGTSKGYLKLNLDEVLHRKDYKVFLNSVTQLSLKQEKTRLSLNDKGKLKFKYGLVEFKYSVPEYQKYLDVKYQYRLKGHIDKWSEWSNDSSVSFENLSFGNYHFEVKAKVGNQVSTNTEEYHFSISRPWYLSNLAILVYLLSLVAIAFLTNKAYKIYYDKILKNRELENKQTIMQIKNEKLNQDIESKNRELAMSTMSIIHKNRLLNKIKKELKKNKVGDNTTAVELIDKKLNDSNDWSYFEKAFNNADKGFFEKIKKAHPDLTPNDLRFCAYLRLNLTSKEIAPLLNITTKSVETKRYRLRKKLGLEHDSGLVNYILDF